MTEAASKKFYVRMMLMGQSGSYKTSFALEFEGPTFIIDWEGKIPASKWSQLAPNGPIGYWTPQDSVDTFGDVYKVTRSFLLGDGAGVKKILSSPGIGGRKRNCSVGEFSINNCKTFVDDGLGRMNDFIKPIAGSCISGGFRKIVPAPQHKYDGEMFQFGGAEGAAFGIRDNFIIQRLAGFAGKACHYILTTRLQTVRLRELEGTVMFVPLLDGKALPPKLPDFFHEIYMTGKVVTGEDPKKTIRFVVDAEGDGESSSCRTSIGVPPSFVSAVRTGNDHFEPGLGWKVVEEALARVEGARV
jgi:hypothetical protein